MFYNHSTLRTPRLDSVSSSSVGTFSALVVIHRSFVPFVKPRDVIKCCMFTLMQQDSDHRRTQLTNTTSL